MCAYSRIHAVADLAAVLDSGVPLCYSIATFYGTCGHDERVVKSGLKHVPITQVKTPHGEGRPKPWLATAKNTCTNAVTGGIPVLTLVVLEGSNPSHVHATVRPGACLRAGIHLQNTYIALCYYSRGA